MSDCMKLLAEARKYVAIKDDGHERTHQYEIILLARIDALLKSGDEYVMVPREATMDMIEAGIGTFDDDFKSWDQVDINNCWEAMIAAAPLPQKEGES